MSMSGAEGEVRRTAEELKEALGYTGAAKTLLAENAEKLSPRRDPARDEVQTLIASMKTGVETLIAQATTAGLLASDGGDLELAIRGNNAEAVEKLSAGKQIVMTGHIALNKAVGVEKATELIGVAEAAVTTAHSSARGVNIEFNTTAKVRYIGINWEATILRAHLRKAFDSISIMDGLAQALLPAQESGAGPVQTAFDDTQASEEILSQTIEHMQQYRVE